MRQRVFTTRPSENRKLILNIVAFALLRGAAKQSACPRNQGYSVSCKRGLTMLSFQKQSEAMPASNKFLLKPSTWVGSG